MGVHRRGGPIQEGVVGEGDIPALGEGEPLVDVGHGLVGAHALSFGVDKELQLAAVGVEDTDVLVGNALKQYAGRVLGHRGGILRVLSLEQGGRVDAGGLGDEAAVQQSQLAVAVVDDPVHNVLQGHQLDHILVAGAVVLGHRVVNKGPGEGVAHIGGHRGTGGKHLALIGSLGRAHIVQAVAHRRLKVGVGHGARLGVALLVLGVGDGGQLLQVSSQGLLHNGQDGDPAAGVHCVHDALHRVFLHRTPVVLIEHVVVDLQGGQLTVIGNGGVVDDRGGEEGGNAVDLGLARVTLTLGFLEHVVLGLQRIELLHGLQVVGAVDVPDVHGKAGAQVVGHPVVLGVVGKEEGGDHVVAHRAALGGNVGQGGG